MKKFLLMLCLFGMSGCTYEYHFQSKANSPVTMDVPPIDPFDPPPDIPPYEPPIPPTGPSTPK